MFNGLRDKDDQAWLFVCTIDRLREEMRRQEGEPITLYHREKIDNHAAAVPERYRIVKAYRWHVLLQNGLYHESFTYHELYRHLRKDVLLSDTEEPENESE